MRCLYCGKELALLKRLTGGGEFCSDAHKQSYQEEYNRLGLSRLLQARTRADESKSAQKTPVLPVAVIDPPAEQIVAKPVQEVPAKSVQEIAKKEVTPQHAPPAVVAAPPEPPPPAMAGFTMEMPSPLVAGEPVSYLEPWMTDDDDIPSSHAPAWRLEVPSVEESFFALQIAGLVPLEVQPSLCESNYSVLDASVAPRDGGQPKVHLSIPLQVTSSHEFQHGGSVVLEVAPRPSGSSSYASLNGALDFPYPVAGRAFDLLDLAPSGIAYPGENCDVTVPETWTDGVLSEGALDGETPHNIDVPTIRPQPRDPELPSEPEPIPVPATPRAALVALSRLHQDMREREEALPAAGAPGSGSAASPESAKLNGKPGEPSVAEPSKAEPTPRGASDLLVVPLKSFAPPKAAAVIDAHALLTDGNPRLPRLKALPLRPKVALAPRAFGQQTKAAPAANPPAEPKKAAPSTPPAPAEVKPKTSAPDKPIQVVQTPKPAPATKTAPAPKPAQTVETLKPEAPATAKKATRPIESVKEKKAASPAQTVSSAPASVPQKPEEVARPISVKVAPAAPKPEPIAEPKKLEPTPKAPAAKTEPPAKTAATAAKTAAAAAGNSAGTTDHTVPNFGAVVNTSMFGSFKVKIGLVVLAASIGIGAYFVAAGKPKTPAPTKASDGVGPSIMVGEGGWVEGWGGDPIGLRADRQITIYRPSLKLSDYRFEFQGQIDTKSIGWIFRAADPQNYYAMKLQLVSPELPLTVVLYKYMVLKGRQVQVGRVPIDVPVKGDTVFSIRVDVRGPKFNTFVQGQPVDFWTDDQLRSGGVGFLNERSERGKIKSVSLSYLSGGTK